MARKKVSPLEKAATDRYPTPELPKRYPLAKGGKMQDASIWVGWESEKSWGLYGNPWAPMKGSEALRKADGKLCTLDESLERYDLRLSVKLEKDPSYLDELFDYKFLCCRCKKDQKCHVDILIKHLRDRLPVVVMENTGKKAKWITEQLALQQKEAQKQSKASTASGKPAEDSSPSNVVSMTPRGNRSRSKKV